MSERLKRTPKRYRCTQILFCGCGLKSSSVFSQPFSFFQCYRISSHKQLFQLLQFTNITRLCSHLVITHIQSPVSILTSSHSSFFNSPISSGNVIIWLLLRSSLHSHIQPFQLLQFTNLIRQCSNLVITHVQSSVSILTCSHSSFFSSPISSGNEVIWLLLTSSF